MDSPLICTFALVCSCLCVAPCSAAQVVELVQTAEKPTTSGGQPDRLSPKTPVTLSTKSVSGVDTISIDPNQRFQTIDGFGGAITDSTASVFAKLNQNNQEKVANLLWGATGQKYNLMRLTIGATDFSTVSSYSYDDTSGDYNMSKFSIVHDKKEIIPMIQRAQAAAAESGSGGSIKFLATPWSPPAWMKSNNHMRNSLEPGLIQEDKIKKAYALYLSKYVTAMGEHGINISRLTVQNEPHVKGQFAATYPCCGFNATDELLFLRDFLGPQMSSDHPELNIFIHDDQKDIMVPYVQTIMADPQAAKFVSGVAFHWYGANLKNYQYLQQLHAIYPSLPLLATEATLEAPASQSLGTTPWKEAQKYAVDIMGDLNEWTTGWIEWNVLLDTSGGPTCIGPQDTGLCTPVIGHCDAPILADTGKQELTIRDSYWIMGHFSRFISRGSVRCGQTGATDPNATMLATSVITPTGDLVVVVVNTDDASGGHQYQLAVPGDTLGFGNITVYAKFDLPPHGVHTLTIRNITSAFEQA